MPPTTVELFARTLQRLPQPFIAGLSLCVAALVGLALIASLTACRGPGHKPQAELPSQRQPVVRVRVDQGLGQVRIDGAAEAWLGPPPNQPASPRQPEPQRVALPLEISRDLGGFVVRSEPTGTVHRWLYALSVYRDGGSALRVNGTAYPQAIVLRPASPDTLNIDVFNHVDIERYLPGVLTRELYPNWHHETFKAQAVAARSYVLAVMRDRRDSVYDVTATTQDQVYGGLTDHPGAWSAVRETFGQVLTWEGEVIPAFYSACTGGSGQDAAAAFLYAPDIPPLKGQSHQGLGEACPRYRWGPFERPTADLTRRFTAWGSRRGHQVAQIQGLSDIAISQRNDAGRPTEFRVVDRLGRDFFLRPIQFRAACNFQPPELPRLKRENTLHSSHVTVWVDSDVTRFTDGRGFGHGVGLGQWEAQDLAEQGKAAQTILQRFYPEAKIERAY